MADMDNSGSLFHFHLLKCCIYLMANIMKRRGWVFWLFFFFFFLFPYSSIPFSPLFNSVCQKKSYQEAAMQVNQSGPERPGTVCYNSKGNEAYIMKPPSNRLINTSLFFQENDPILNSSGLYNILIYYLLKGRPLYKMHSYLFILL